MTYTYTHTWYQCQFPGSDIVLSYVRCNHWGKLGKGQMWPLWTTSESSSLFNYLKIKTLRGGKNETIKLYTESCEQKINNALSAQENTKCPEIKKQKLSRNFSKFDSPKCSDNINKTSLNYQLKTLYYVNP